MRKRRRSKGRSVFLFMLMSVAMLFIAISYKRVSLDSRRTELENQKKELEAQREDLFAEGKRIQQYEDYVNSSKFVEDTARDKLGLVYPNEYVFKPKKKE